MKILVCSITAGQGHNSAGRAVVAACEQRGISCEMVDTLLLTGKFSAWIFDASYLWMLRYAPGLMGWMDRFLLAEGDPGRRRGVNRLIGSLFHRKVRRYIRAYQPDAIVVTHVYAALILTHIREKYGLDPLVVGINTDFSLQSLWDDVKVDFLVLAAKGMIPECTRRHIPEEILLPLGIPIHARFQNRMTKEEARRILGIEHRDTILIMSGSMGFGDLPQVIYSLSNLTTEMQVLVVCGSNEKMKRELERLSPGFPLMVYGFVQNVEVLMDAADLMLSKPGGLSTSECLAKRLPLVMLRPIPGLEERNARFLEQEGLAILSSADLPPHKAAQMMLSNPTRREEMIRRQDAVGNAYAAGDLVDKIKEVLDRGISKGAQG